jgi:hypothetical protein
MTYPLASVPTMSNNITSRDTQLLLAGVAAQCNHQKQAMKLPASIERPSKRNRIYTIHIS